MKLLHMLTQTINSYELFLTHITLQPQTQMILQHMLFKPRFFILLPTILTPWLITTKSISIWLQIWLNIQIVIKLKEILRTDELTFF